MMEFSIEGVAAISVDREIPCLHTVWHGYATSKQFREIILNSLGLIRDYGLDRGLSDNRNMKMISMEDQNWLTGTIIPEFIAAGYRASALIVPQDYFAKVSIDMLIRKAEDSAITSRYFEDEDSAREWLKSLG